MQIITLWYKATLRFIEHSHPSKMRTTSVQSPTKRERSGEDDSGSRAKRPRRTRWENDSAAGAAAAPPTAGPAAKGPRVVASRADGSRRYKGQSDNVCIVLVLDYHSSQAERDRRAALGRREGEVDAAAAAPNRRAACTFIRKRMCGCVHAYVSADLRSSFALCDRCASGGRGYELLAQHHRQLLFSTGATLANVMPTCCVWLRGRVFWRIRVCVCVLCAALCAVLCLCAVLLLLRCSLSVTLLRTGSGRATQR